MADESFVLVDQLIEDFDLENELFDDEDYMMVFSAVSCYMRRNLNRIDGYFEVTVPTYEPSEFPRGGGYSHKVRIGVCREGS